MKYYRHMITMREQLILERKKDRIQTALDLLLAVFLAASMYLITIWVLA